MPPEESLNSPRRKDFAASRRSNSSGAESTASKDSSSERLVATGGAYERDVDVLHLPLLAQLLQVAESVGANEDQDRDCAVVGDVHQKSRNHGFCHRAGDGQG